MPTIPDVRSLGQRPIPESNRRILSDQSGQIKAGAVIDLGNRISQVGGAIQEKDDRLNYAQARSEFLQADIAARKELESDPDWQTYEQKYRDKVGKAREEAVAKIRNPRDRELFSLETQTDFTRGAAAVSGIARQREVDSGRANLNSLLETNRNSALNADPETGKAFVSATAEAIHGAQRKNYISAQEAQSIGEKWDTDYSEGRVLLLHPEERVKVLSSPKGTIAEKIDPVRRSLLLKQAQGENKETRVRSESQAQADKIVGSGTLESQLAEARKITDPDVRDATVARIKARESEKQAEQNLNDAANRRSAWSVVLNGGKWEDIPVSVVQNMDPQDAIALKNALKSGIDNVKTDPATQYRLKQFAGDSPKEFSSLDLLKYRDKLSQSDFEQFTDLQEKIKADTKAGYSVQTDNQLVNSALDGMGIDRGAKANSKDIERAGQFTAAFDKRVQTIEQETGRKATVDEKRRIIDRLSIEVVTGHDWFGFGDVRKRAFEADRVLEVVVPPKEKDKIIEAFKNVIGRDPTQSEIEDLYLKGKGL